MPLFSIDDRKMNSSYEALILFVVLIKGKMIFVSSHMLQEWGYKRLVSQRGSGRESLPVM